MGLNPSGNDMGDLCQGSEVDWGRVQLASDFGKLLRAALVVT